ncbi:glucose-6-phosphate dehydrogenase [Nocardioides sp.]|uniref:glucose-6-phosphate dehydrogenase n=1 Tax=Nocardioides sp. TaxID=35761 RepID=UPI00273238BF|nr:glucose-6-phosphate dehydrogenase [Nocardioides sp.]MDP3890422.1 glucose-6-phosphate dehydrogenase [Nocardioides sp.]
MTARDGVGTLLVLGASGDLTSRLLLPGLATLLASDRGADLGPLTVLGSGRQEFTDRQWQARVRKSFARAGVRGARLTEVARRSRYAVADVTDPDDLRRLLGECDGAPAIYFALPPAITERACRALTQVELPPGTTLVLEKPFGESATTARRLNRLVESLVPEERIFRVDHFLGRGDILNVLGLRFANRLLEPVWSREHIERIEIHYDEDLALEGRAGYYDNAGALVDMVQSHLLHVMAILMMEPVANLDEWSFREAKAAVLRATELAGPPTESSRRARYTAGTIGRRKVPAYTREQGVDPARRTETLAEVTVEVKSWRWAGVPVVLRSGKALGATRKEAVITLKPVPHLPEGLRGTETPDTITIGFKPPRVGFRLDVNGPGDPFELGRAEVETELGDGELTAYGEVLGGVLAGDPLLAVGADNAVECWRVLDPVVRAWGADEVPMDTYPAGSDGPRGWR